jgi:nicotinamide-nucleotide amidase
MKVRLTAKAATLDDANAVLEHWSARVHDVVGSQVFGLDDETMEFVVLELLRSQGHSLGLAESVTGGLVASRLTGVAGASDVFRGAIVSYASEVKFDLLGVPEGPVVSESAAGAMAVGAQRALGASVGLALTGVAGPTEQDGMPVGTLCIGLAIGDVVYTTTARLPGQREQMRQMSVITALDFLRRTLLAAND